MELFRFSISGLLFSFFLMIAATTLCELILINTSESWGSDAVQRYFYETTKWSFVLGFGLAYLLEIGV